MNFGFSFIIGLTIRLMHNTTILHACILTKGSCLTNWNHNWSKPIKAAIISRKLWGESSRTEKWRERRKKSEKARLSCEFIARHAEGYTRSDQIFVPSLNQSNLICSRQSCSILLFEPNRNKYMQYEVQKIFIIRNPSYWMVNVTISTITLCSAEFGSKYFLPLLIKSLHALVV